MNDTRWDEDDEAWDDNWSDWTDDVEKPEVDSESVVRRREAARRAAEHDGQDDQNGGQNEVETGVAARPATTRAGARQSAKRTSVVEDQLARPARRGSGCLVSLIVCGLLIGIGAYGYSWVKKQIDPGAPGATIEVSVPSGTSGSELGKLLHKEGVIGDPNVWRAWSQLNPVGKFQAGRYKFTKNSSFDEVVAVLANTPAVPQEQPLTIPPGLRITQIAGRVAELPGRDAERFIAATKQGIVKSVLLPNESAKNLEGFVVAETINFDLNDDEGEILAKLVDEWDNTARKAGIMDAEAKVGYTPYEVLIVASLIEREAKFDDERPKVARVIYNRLKAKMYLQLDATTVYDLGGGVPTAADLKNDAPYNTYTNKGLTPTPIATPSIESIKAALAPTEGDWIYYVVTEADGRSSFANSFAEHKRNIAKAKKAGVLK
jgi:UPF0755 protein